MDAVAATSHAPIWYGANVLVVDNEPVMRSLVRRRLEAEDFHVEEAKDGESALADSEPVLNRLRNLGIGYAQGHALALPEPLANSEGELTLVSSN